MLFAPPLEIIDLLEDVYDEDGNFIEEKLSDSATIEQHEIFENYKKECIEMKRSSIRVNLSDKAYDQIDGWINK